MKKSTKYLEQRFAGKTLSKSDLKRIKGGDDDERDDDDYNSEEARRKRCLKAWQEATEEARRSGRRIKRISGNGNGIW